MLRRRRAALDTAQRDGAASNHAVGVARALPQEETPADAREDEAPETSTLETLCACGHTRRDHTGLRLGFNGRCLECDCKAFTARRSSTRPEEDVLARVQAAIAHVERLEQIALGLRVDRASSRGGHDAAD